MRCLLILGLLLLPLTATAQKETDPGNDATVVSHTLPTLMECGSKQVVSVTVQNTGKSTWSGKAAYGLMGVNNTAFEAEGTAQGAQLPADVDVAPGQSYTFELDFVVPSAPGNHTSQWQMTQGGTSQFGGIASETTKVACQISETDAAEVVSHTIPAFMECGTTQDVSITFQNTGTSTWRPEHLYVLRSPGNQDPMSSKTEWSLPAGTAVSPGQSYTFQLPLTAPAVAGSYSTDWKMLHKRLRWFGETALSTVNVLCVGGEVPDAAVVVVDPPNNYGTWVKEECGTETSIFVTLQNTGKALWGADTFLAATGGSDPYRTDADPRVPLPHSVFPGETVTVEVPLSMPPDVQVAQTSEWQLVRGASEWFGEIATKQLLVRCQLNESDDARVVSHTFPDLMECGSTQRISVTMENTGTSRWRKDLKMRLGDPGNKDPFKVTHRVDLPAGLEIGPGGAHTFEFDIKAPDAAGTYTTDWRMVHEWVRWFGETAAKQIDVTCSDYGVEFLQPRAQVLADGGKFDWGVLHEGEAPRPFTFRVAAPDNFKGELYNLRVVSEEGPVAVYFGQLSSGSGSLQTGAEVPAEQGLDIGGTLAVKPEIKELKAGEQVAFRAVIAFDHSLGESFEFEIVGLAQKASCNGTDSWSFVFEDYPGPFNEVIPEEQLPRQLAYRGRITNNDGAQCLEIPESGINVTVVQRPFGVNTDLEVFGGPTIVLQPGESYVFRVLINATVSAESGEYSANIGVSPSGTSVVDTLNISGTFEIQGPDLSLDNVSVRLLSSGISVGHFGIFTIDPVDASTNIDFEVRNDNPDDMHVEAMSASISGPAASGLSYNPTPVSAVVPAGFPSVFGGQLQVLSSAVPGDFTIHVNFRVTDGDFTPEFDELFSFDIQGTLTACGGGGNCGPIVSVEDQNGNSVRGTHRLNLANEGTHDLVFKIFNIGDEELSVNPALQLSGDGRFSVQSSPSPTTVPPDGAQTSNFTLRFNADGTGVNDTFATNVTINGNGANTPYTFTLEVTTRPPIPLVVEVIGFVTVDNQVDLGTHEQLPLLPVIRITNPTSDFYYVKSFRTLQSQGGPLEWTWESPVPASSENSSAWRIDKDGGQLHAGGKIDLNGDPGDVNGTYTFNFSFEFNDGRYGTYSTYNLAIKGELDGVYNPAIDAPVIDCEDPDNVCVSNFCGAVQSIFDDQPVAASVCVASALATYWGCLGCGSSNTACWAICGVGIIGSLGCGLVADDLIEDLAQAVIDTRACYCDTFGEFCEETYYIGYEVTNLPVGTAVNVRSRCRTTAGLDIQTVETVSLSNSLDFDLIRCPKSAIYELWTDPVQVLPGNTPYRCTLANPRPGDRPEIPEYNGLLDTHFTGVFDCGCTDPTGCGQFYTLVGSAQDLQPGDAITVVANLEGDHPTQISATVTVTQNGQFQFLIPVPESDSYVLTIENKNDYPQCTVEPTGNPISGPGNVVDIARLSCDSTRPNVRILVPADGDTVQPNPSTGAILVQAVAGDANGIRHVIFYEDGVPIGTATSAGNVYEIQWVPSGSGTRTLQALAENIPGVTTFSDPVSVTVTGTVACDNDTQPPTIVRVFPAAGEAAPQGLGGSLTLEAEVVDDTGMNHVDFYLDGNKVTVFGNGPLFLFTAPQVSLGAHTLRVVAVDVCGKPREIAQYDFTVVESDPTLAAGALNVADCSILYGFASDINHTNSVLVEFYKGGPRGSGTLVGQDLANGSCTGLPGDPNQCFSLSTPAALKTGFPETVYAHARDIDTQGQPTGAWPQLLLSPKTITCEDSGGTGNPPPIPAGVSASDGAYTDRVRVTWNASSGASAYEVYRNSVNNSSTATMIESDASTTLYDDMDVQSGPLYYYWLKARNGDGSSGFSTVNTGYASTVTVNNHLPDGTLDVADCDHVAGWVRDADYTGRTQAHIYRDGPAGGGGTVVATIWADLTRPGLPFPDQDHGFDWSVPAGSIPHGTPIYVYGLNVDSNGDFDGDNTLLNGSPMSFNCPSAPAAPSGVNATDGTYSDRVRITWNATSGATSYSIWRHTSNNSAQAVSVRSGQTSTLWDDMGVTPGTTYYYWVKAHSSAGTSPFSAVNSGYANNTPVNQHLPDGTLDVADCDHIAGWVRDADYTGRTQAHIYRDGPAGGGGTVVATIWADLHRPGLPFPDQDHGFDWSVPAGSIPHGTPIYVYGLNVDSHGDFDGDNTLLNGSPMSFNCPSAPAAPSGVNATDGTYSDRVRITWNATSGATSYSIWRHTSNNSAQAVSVRSGQTSTLWDDMGVTPGTTYYYWVKAHSSAGTSPFSAVNSGYANNTPVNQHLPDGTLDVADCDHIAGWVRDADYTGRTQAHIYRDGPAGGGGTVVATIWADLTRPGLPFPDKDHGFDWAVPEGSIPHGTPIYVYGLNVDSHGNFNGDNTLLNGSPMSFNCPASAPPVNNHQPEGTLDVADCTHIAGWARDADNTDPIQVHIYKGGPAGAGGQVVATILADLNRPGLPFPDTNHGFDWPVPAGSIPAGTPIYVYGINVNSHGEINGSSPLLNLSPRPLTCP